MKAQVILFDDAELQIEQKRILDARFAGYGWEIVRVPKINFSQDKVTYLVNLFVANAVPVVFASPSMVLLNRLAYEEGLGSGCEVYVFDYSYDEGWRLI